MIEEFDGAWLLIEHSPGRSQLVGIAEDYDAARAWLVQPQDSGQPDNS